MLLLISMIVLFLGPFGLPRTLVQVHAQSLELLPGDAPSSTLKAAEVITPTPTRDILPASTASTTITNIPRITTRSSSGNRKDPRQRAQLDDILSGLVKLLGGKNVHVASGEKPPGPSRDKQHTTSTTPDPITTTPPARINNRAPPKLTFAVPNVTAVTISPKPSQSVPQGPITEWVPARLPGQLPSVAAPAPTASNTATKVQSSISTLSSSTDGQAEKGAMEITHGTTPPLPTTTTASTTTTAITTPSPVTGRPHVIPVDIEDIVGHAQPILTGEEQAPVPTKSTTEHSVFIDGRKTYFNLMPTDTGAMAPHDDSTLVNVGVGFNFDNEPGAQQPRPVPQPSAGIVSDAGPATRPRPGTRPGAKPQPPRQHPAKTNVEDMGKSPIRIDTCIVGDENACDAKRNESCRVEAGVSSCTCRPGYWRQPFGQGCAPAIALFVYIQLDRLGSTKLSFNPRYGDPNSEEYQALEAESKLAVDSVFAFSDLADTYLGCAINAFFSINGKVTINSTVHLAENSQTREESVKRFMRKTLLTAIEQRQQNLGRSRLYVVGRLNPIPGIQDANSCADPNMNDCSELGVCEKRFGGFDCKCNQGYADKYAQDPGKAGRVCAGCLPEYCNNRGECTIINGVKSCACQGNYIGTRCETDGEVLGVALGASLAALFIIILTLVCLCMWSRRWKRDQKAVMRGASTHDTGFSYLGKPSAPGATLPHETTDRPRWPRLVDQTDNFYAQPDPLPTEHHLPYVIARPPRSSSPQHLRSMPTALTSSRSNILDDTDEDNFATARFQFPRPKTKPPSSNADQSNIYYDITFPSAYDPYGPVSEYASTNVFQLKNMRPTYN